MDVIPSLLGETEFREFTKSDYAVFGDILDDNLAKYIKDYMNNPNADPEIVESIKSNMGGLIKSLTIHFELQDRGIIKMLESLSPETITLPECDLDSIEESLEFLVDNYNNLKLDIAPRSRENYNQFISMLKGVVARLQDKGIPTTYPNLLKRIESNKFVFYIPNDKGHTTSCNIVVTKSKQWKSCLSGIKYLKYCNERGIGILNRRSF